MDREREGQIGRHESRASGLARYTIPQMLRPHLYLYLSVSIHLSVFVTGDALLCFLERTAVAAGVEQVNTRA